MGLLPAQPLSFEGDQCTGPGDSGGTLARRAGCACLHACMQASSSELTIVSAREVLKRLAGVGVIVFQPDRTYRFTNEAWEMLKPDVGGGPCKINSL